MGHRVRRLGALTSTLHVVRRGGWCTSGMDGREQLTPTLPFMTKSHGTGPSVMIVGGGPAGTATAIALKQFVPDALVTLIDKESFPRDKPCGDGLGPGARKTLDELGLAHLMETFNMPDSVVLSGPDSTEASARGPMIGGKDLSGYVAPRLAFDALLLAECETLGVTVRTGECFRSMAELDDQRVQVTSACNDDKSPRVAAYDFLIAADGAYSSVRRHLGLAVATDANTHIAARSYAKISHPTRPLDKTLRLDFIDSLLPAYGWVFPLGGGRANIGIGIPMSRFKGTHRTLQDLLSVYVEDLKRRGFIVGELEQVRSHKLPHAGARLKMTSKRVVFIGDSAGMINPMSGEGMFYGMAAGVQLARRLEGRLDLAAVDWVHELRAFESAFRRRFRVHFFSCYMAHQLMKSRAWAKFFISFAARRADVMAMEAFLMFDEATISGRTLIRATLGKG